MIQVYTGNGKGKTTAAIGLALRSLGRGRRVALLQFLKLNETGEMRGLSRFENCQVQQFGTSDFITEETAKELDRQLAQEGCSRAEEILCDKAADLVILDEINVALHLKLIKLERVIDLIAACPPEIELVLTGRDCPPEIISLADYVSEIKEIKHPYRKGIIAREGIEF
jgi:cob(I)alamin adenosyltransferase